MSTHEKTVITVKASIQAPIEKVWKLYNDPRHVMQWNNASDDWHSTRGQSDLRAGGRFNFHMAAKDGSQGFDFEGVYTEVVDQKRIAYKLGDDREVTIDFEPHGDKVDVTVAFEAENTFPHEFQREGWQSILDSFKRHAESPAQLERLHFDIHIDAPVEKVVSTMLHTHYKEWTAEFHPGSDYQGSWDEGAKILFVSISDDGETSGMVSRIEKHIPNRFVSIEHLGFVDKGVEITSGPEIEGWAGAHENYIFAEKDGGTLLTINTDSNEQYKDYFLEAWPRALAKLKELCEA